MAGMALRVNSIHHVMASLNLRIDLASILKLHIVRPRSDNGLLGIGRAHIVILVSLLRRDPVALGLLGGVLALIDGILLALATLPVCLRCFFGLLLE